MLINYDKYTESLPELCVEEGLRGKYFCTAVDNLVGYIHDKSINSFTVVKMI